MTKREFNFMLRTMKPKDQPVTKWVRKMLTPEQAARLEESDMVKERNTRKRSPSYWRKVFLHQCWEIMFPGQPLK